MKRFALEMGPIRHRIENRVRAHAFVCMLARYVRWHLERALAPLLLTDHDPLAAQARRDSIGLFTCLRPPRGGGGFLTRCW